MDKRKALIGAGVVAGAGVLLYSQKGKDTPFGTAGDLIAAPIDGIMGAPDTGVDGSKKSPSISELFEMLPAVSGDGGSGLPWTPDPSQLGYGDEPTIVGASQKKKYSLPTGLGTGMSRVLGGGARIGATGVMLPTQILGGGAARVTDYGIRKIMGKGYERRMVPAQKARVKKYPRASHAVSMVTGGATRRAPVTKKQQAARKKYPRAYKAWKSVFSWVGA